MTELRAAYSAINNCRPELADYTKYIEIESFETNIITFITRRSDAVEGRRSALEEQI